MDQAPVRLILMYFIVPLWLAAGVADWLCHRRAKIQDNASYPESLLHLLMLAEIGAPTLLVLFCKVNALTLAVCIAAFLAHEVTALWDVSYAVKRRDVTPVEQHVHSFLELVPLMALICLAALHWGQFEALFGFGGEAADFSVQVKQPGLSAGYLTAVLVGVAVFEAAPFAEELIRCVAKRRAERGSVRGVGGLQKSGSR